ncbi:WD40 repeat domain-containing protein [Streptomyces sp. NBC_00647]|uniref:WD40 repeat domain-containing protein n=1 Tax=Streptomyces sp. NBC_00647 TaxID=2975796 RepID=UPI003249B850
MRTPWGIWGDWRWRRFEERVRAREAAEWLRETGHEDWGDDRIGTALTTVFNLRESLDARRLSALRPGVGLGVAEVKEAWAGMDGGPYAFTLNLLERLRDVRLVTVAPAADGRMRLTVPEGLRDRLRPHWTADEEAEWHERLLDNARVLAQPGGTWLDLPVLADYWWRNLIWHLWHSAPEKAAALVVYPSWQIARIQRLEVRGLLADLVLVDSPESRAAASVIDEVLSRLDPAAPDDPRGLADELSQALGLAEQVVVAQRPPAHHAVLRLPVRTQDFAMSPDSTWLVAVGRDKHIRIYDVAAQAVRQVIAAPPEVGYNCAVAPDGSFIMTKSAGEDARAWDAATGEERIPFEVGDLADSVYGPGDMWLSYDAATGDLVNPLTGERLPTKPLGGQVGRLALAADGSVLAMGNARGQIGLWDPRTGRRAAKLPDHPYAVDRLGMAPDGSWIAIGDLYGIRVLDLPGGDERFTVKQRGTDFATTEDWLAVPDRERVQIRSTRSGELLNTLELRTENIQECHLSPDRKYLLTMDREGTLIMWDAAAVVP